MPRSSALRRWFRSFPLLRQWFADPPRGPARKRKAARRPLSLEPLEDRTLPATFIVNTPYDVVDPNDGLTSLRVRVSSTVLITCLSSPSPRSARGRRPDVPVVATHTPHRSPPPQAKPVTERSHPPF